MNIRQKEAFHDDIICLYDLVFIISTVKCPDVQLRIISTWNVPSDVFIVLFIIIRVSTFVLCYSALGDVFHYFCSNHVL